jgi:polysaccharide export outer membrane protein
MSIDVERSERPLRWPRRCAVVAFAALAGAGALGQAEAPVQTEAPPVQEGDIDPNSYVIGPGDQLNVFVWREPTLSIVVPVRPDGQISTPLVKDIVAVGKTPTQLGRDIETVLAKYLRTPQVTVIVQNFVGTFASQVRVLGQVVRPGPVRFRESMTLLDVLLEVGGLTQFAAGNRSKLVRTVDGESVELRVRLERLLERGDLEENVPVQPGDVVIVPAAVF